MTKLKYENPPKDLTHIRRGPSWGSSKKPEEPVLSTIKTLPSKSALRKLANVQQRKAEVSGLFNNPILRKSLARINRKKDQQQLSTAPLKDGILCPLCRASIKAKRYEAHIRKCHTDIAPEALPEFAARILKSFSFYWNGKTYTPPIGVEGSVALMESKIFFAPYGAIDENGVQICIEVSSNQLETISLSRPLA